MGTIITESWGSQQWRLLRRNLRDGMPIEEAAPLSGMNLIEARALEKLDAQRAPLPDEAFALLYDPDAPRAASSTQAKEAGMAKVDDSAVEYRPPEPENAIKRYDQFIKPKKAKIDTLKGDMAEPWGDMKEHDRISKKDFNYVQSLVDEEDDSKRDHRLFGLAGLLRARGLFMPRDLDTMARGEDGSEIVPIGERPEVDMFSDDVEDNENLPVAAEDERPDDAEPGEQIDGFTEASDAEISKQQGRGRGRKAKSEPAAGAGTAAMKAISESAQQNASMLQ